MDGVYDKDPELHDDARLFSHISYNEVIQSNIRVLDMTAITFCQDNNIPLRVFNMTVPGNLMRVIKGEMIGSLVD